MFEYPWNEKNNTFTWLSSLYNPFNWIVKLYNFNLVEEWNFDFVSIWKRLAKILFSEINVLN